MFFLILLKVLFATGLSLAPTYFIYLTLKRFWLAGEASVEFAIYYLGKDKVISPEEAGAFWKVDILTKSKTGFSRALVIKLSKENHKGANWVLFFFINNHLILNRLLDDFCKKESLEKINKIGRNNWKTSFPATGFYFIDSDRKIQSNSKEANKRLPEFVFMYAVITAENLNKYFPERYLHNSCWTWGTTEISKGRVIAVRRFHDNSLLMEVEFHKYNSIKHPEYFMVEPDLPTKKS